MVTQPLADKPKAETSFELVRQSSFGIAFHCAPQRAHAVRDGAAQNVARDAEDGTVRGFKHRVAHQRMQFAMAEVPFAMVCHCESIRLHFGVNDDLGIKPAASARTPVSFLQFTIFDGAR